MRIREETKRQKELREIIASGEATIEQIREATRILPADVLGPAALEKLHGASEQ